MDGAPGSVGTGAMDRAAIYSFMAGERYGVVSSVAEDGSPQSALVGIAVTTELEVIFDTMKSSRKYANLQRRPECSVVIGLGGQAEEKTVQMEGLAAKPSAEELRVYFAAWPDGRERMKWPGIAHFVVRPKWVRYSDFSQVPAVIEELGMGE